MAADLRVVNEPPPLGRSGRIILWVTMIIGLMGAGICFAYKVAEFLFTLGDDGVKGFADVPVTVYFVVALGWLFLLVWCFATGKFSHAEQAKLDMIALEEEYERRGE
jgi:hypothetical protein